MAHVVTAGELLDGHSVLDVECLDRIYLNAYVPILQSSGQVVAFMTQHLGKPIPSPALMEHIGTRFRRAVESYASSNGIPWVRFGKGDRKIDVMQPYLQAQAATGRSGVAAVGVSQEFQRVWSACQRDTRTAAPQYTFSKADRRVTCYYFYLWDEDFGGAFIKVCAYFPYPAKIWVNGHEWAKRQALRAGIGFTELSNGFASCEDPAALQEICDRLQPGTIEVFAQRWMHRIPMWSASRPSESALTRYHACRFACRADPRTRSSWRSCTESGRARIRASRAAEAMRPSHWPVVPVFRAISVVVAALRHRRCWYSRSAARVSREPARQVASVVASAIAWHAPWARSGVIGWMASPISATRPRAQVRVGRRS